MADVFLSYRNTPERRAFVKRLALLLRANEVTVWWDYGLEAGDSYRAQITEELAQARLVAPIWCFESVQSKWVRLEAELGKDKLVPARLQRVTPPAEFEHIHAADLVGWDGTVRHILAQAFVAKICERLGRSTRTRLDMTEELSELRSLTPMPDIAEPPSGVASAGLDATLADLRATWNMLAAKHDRASAERFQARVRETAPGSGLEFEIDEHLTQLRAEAERQAEELRDAETARLSAQAKREDQEAQAREAARLRTEAREREIAAAVVQAGAGEGNAPKGLWAKILAFFGIGRNKAAAAPDDRQVSAPVGENKAARPRVILDDR